jgi:hypothetical protein
MFMTEMKKIKDLIVISLGTLSVIYLLNFDAGIFEFIPDNFPLIGNLDEVAATALLLKCLAYFGYDFRGLLKPRAKKTKTVDV